MLYGDGQEHVEVETNHEEERRGAPLSKIKDGEKSREKIKWELKDV